MDGQTHARRSLKVRRAQQEGEWLRAAEARATSETAGMRGQAIRNRDAWQATRKEDGEQIADGIRKEQLF